MVWDAEDEDIAKLCILPGDVRNYDQMEFVTKKQVIWWLELDRLRALRWCSGVLLLLGQDIL